MTDLKTIVIARTVSDFVINSDMPDHRDLGYPAPMKEVFRPEAATWLLKGSEADVARAQAHCEAAPEEGWKVYTFPIEEEDPLGRAKKLALRDRR